MVYDPPVTANAMDAYAAPPIIRDEEADYGNTASARGPWSSVFCILATHYYSDTCIAGGFRDQSHTTTCKKDVVCTCRGIRGSVRAGKLFLQDAALLQQRGSLPSEGSELVVFLREQCCCECRSMTGAPPRSAALHRLPVSSVFKNRNESSPVALIATGAPSTGDWI